MDLVIFLPNGKQHWIDVTVFTTDSLTGSRRERDSIEAESDRAKRRKYEEEAVKQHAVYETLAFDVHGSLSQKGASVLKGLARIADLTSSELLRPATHALQISNGEILATARGTKKRELIQKACSSSPLRAAAPDYRPQGPEEELENAIARERLEQQFLSLARAAAAPEDDPQPHGGNARPFPAHPCPPSLRLSARVFAGSGA